MLIAVAVSVRALSDAAKAVTCRHPRGCAAAEHRRGVDVVLDGLRVFGVWWEGVDDVGRLQRHDADAVWPELGGELPTEDLDRAEPHLEAAEVEVARRGTLDAVAFAVPPDVQAELAVVAAQAGKHLLLDKPVATTSTSSASTSSYAAAPSLVAKERPRAGTAGQGEVSILLSQAEVSGRGSA
jgi:hypothetical protein